MKKIIVFFAAIFLITVSAFGADTGPDWIWFPEDAVKDCGNDFRYFRREFILSEQVKESRIRIVADDCLGLFVNGSRIGNDTTGWGTVKEYDMGKYLIKGLNIIAVKVYNSGGPAGLLSQINTTGISGKTEKIFSDISWKASKTAQDGWEKPGFDDTSWCHGISLGGVFAGPWASSILSNYYFRKEYTMYEDIKAMLDMEKPPRIEVKRSGGLPALFINGEQKVPVFYSLVSADPRDEMTRRHIGNFSRAGIHIYNFPVYGPWSYVSEGGNYDFSSIDNALEGVLEVDTEAFVLLRMVMAPPEWWSSKHPDEFIKYAASSVNAGEQNDVGPVKRISLASKPWLEDTGKHFREFLRHIEGSPFGKRVLGYHICYGVYGEWHYFGFNYLPDTGKAMTLRFSKWAEERYGGDTGALRRAWNYTDIGFGDITVPGLNKRIRADKGMFRDPSSSRMAVDYYRCHQEVVRDDLLYLCRIAKEESKNKIAGGFYGYFFFQPNASAQEGGHLCLEDVLNSPYIDFLSSPFSYELRSREVNGDGQLRTIPESVKMAGKLAMCEMDLPTFRGDPQGNNTRVLGVDTPEGSIRGMRRNFCSILARGTGGWWFDIGQLNAQTGGWWDDAKLMEAIRQMQEIGNDSLSRDRSSAAEVLVVCDPGDFYYTANYRSGKDRLTYPMLNDVSHCLFRSGAPFDVIMLSDLGKTDPLKYKAYIFLGDFNLTAGEKEAVAEKVKTGNHVVLWVYAPGYVSDSGLGAEGITALTGITIREIDRENTCQVEVFNIEHPMSKAFSGAVYGIPATISPVFYSDDSSAISLGRITGTGTIGLCVKKFRDWTSVYSFAPPVSTKFLRALFNFAGVHIYDGSDDVIFANSSYLCVNTREGGVRKISLPSKANVFDLFDSRKLICSSASEFEVILPPNSIHLYLLEKPK